MIQVDGREVVVNETVLLRIDEQKVRFDGPYGLVVVVSFNNDGTGRPSLSPRYNEGQFWIPLYNFGSTLGMAVDGRITVNTKATHPRPGAWLLHYRIAVNLIGDKFRNLHLTLVEERVA